MAFVTIRFCAARDAISAVVRMGCYGFRFSHVEVVLPDGSIIGAHAKVGVAHTTGQGAGETYTQDVVVPCSVAQQRVLEAFLFAQVGRPYDYLAIASIAASFFVGPRDWRDPAAWFCSELVTTALEEAGIISDIVDDAARVTPRDLAFILSARPDARWQPIVYSRKDV